MHNQDLPNLFIVGAPKCGTSSLFHWLADHPEVCRTKTKEPNFFLDAELDHLDVNPNHRNNTISDYLKMFDNTSDLTRKKLDGSTHYLYSEPALNFVSSISPAPQVIIQLRNPAARIWSHFYYIKQKAQHPISISFSDYVDVILSNNQSAYQFTDEPWPQHLLENQLNYSNYAHHLRRWRDRLPKGNIKILLLEELSQGKQAAAINTAQWINIDPTFYDDYNFSNRNIAQSPASLKVKNFLGRYPNYFPKPLVNVTCQLINNVAPPPNSKKSSADVRALNKLNEYFFQSVQELQRDFGLNVASWLR